MATNEAVEMAIEINEEENKQSEQETADNKVIEIEKKEINTDEEDKIMNELFYIYHKHNIQGPYNHYDIIKLFIAKEIENEIWVTHITKADDMTKWCRINLSKDQSEGDNESLKGEYPNLYNYLIPKIKNKKISQHGTPVHVPQDAKNKISLTQKITNVLGVVVLFIFALIVGLHLIPGICLASCYALPIGCCIYNMVKDVDKRNSTVGFAFLWVATMGIPTVPPIIVYYVLLDAINYDTWNGEIQSWMIAYITWGICAWVVISLLLSSVLSTHKKMGNAMLDIIFYIVGVDFGSEDKDKILGSSDRLAASVFVVFPSLATLLPSAIIGFIANYVLEEKFELKCSDEITNNLLCFEQEGYGCCQVISSHDVRNMYAFIGGLASNILATWAVIRIIGYVMINSSIEATVFAKRNK